ncbi:MAG: FixH family protein [Reyranella sp.]|uniref:FixH family protein n=1 Tax=Reyranella sp. TaxID=1929291 RepID=UPI001AD59C1C|nr:FixH family protein [Reyranella sp.]MBN9089268.1 FixH family protein [Reyranella sp.]
MRLWAALLALFVSTPAWADCPLDLGHGTGVVFYSDQYMIAMRPEPFRIEVGQPFMLIMNVCTKAGDAAELVRVDATMPEHKHGMNYAPTIRALGDGRYRVDGLLFHMPGNWEVAVDVRPADKPGAETSRLTYDFVLK